MVLTAWWWVNSGWIAVEWIPYLWRTFLIFFAISEKFDSSSQTTCKLVIIIPSVSCQAWKSWILRTPAISLIFALISSKLRCFGVLCKRICKHPLTRGKVENKIKAQISKLFFKKKEN